MFVCGIIVKYCKKYLSLCPPVPQFPGNTNVMVQHIFDNSQWNQDGEDGEKDEQIKRQFNQSSSISNKSHSFSSNVVGNIGLSTFNIAS